MCARWSLQSTESIDWNQWRAHTLHRPTRQHQKPARALPLLISFGIRLFDCFNRSNLICLPIVIAHEIKTKINYNRPNFLFFFFRFLAADNSKDIWFYHNFIAIIQLSKFDDISIFLYEWKYSFLHYSPYWFRFVVLSNYFEFLGLTISQLMSQLLFCNRKERKKISKQNRAYLPACGIFQNVSAPSRINGCCKLVPISLKNISCNDYFVR